MIPISFLRDHQQEAISRLEKRGIKEVRSMVQAVLDLDQKRREAQKELDDTKAIANQKAKDIGKLMSEGKKNEAEEAKKETGQLKKKVAELTDHFDTVAKDFEAALVKLPNIPHNKVPAGVSEEDNEVLMEEGKKPSLTVNEPHWELIKTYDIIDFETGNKLTGAGFPVYKGKGAKLQRALINFFLDEAQAAGYEEVIPPLLVNAASGYGTGQLPDKEGMMYHVTGDDLYLIPTAEVPITNIYRGEMLKEEDLPIKNAGYTPCFRREAGSWGADVRGLNRLHQFDKVEIVQVVLPKDSYATLETMSEYVQGLLKKLGLPYRVLRLCGGDLGFSAAMTYDMEVFSAAQERWLEVSSVSNFESFQANRLKLRYKDKQKQTHLLHTLNGSALALPRILAAILENNQTEDGIVIPEVLRSYTGFDKITK